MIVFNGEGNRLNAYDVATGEKQTVIPSAADVEGTSTPGRDINAQICFDPAHLDDDPATPNFFIAGEDTGQESGQTVAGGQGWGYFELTGNRVGEFGWRQLGKMDPTYNNTADNPENYGCGFLSDGRLVTSDVGDQQPQSGANGQLIVWFPPFDRTDVPYCKIAVDIPTAGHPFLTTPSAVVPAPNGNLYASSVFDGKISEFAADGTFVSSVLVPPPGLPPYGTGTPLGLGIGPDGTLYYADIGIVLGPPPGPGDGNGSVRSLDPGTGPPGSPQKLDDGLAFPDGIGVLVLPAATTGGGTPQPPAPAPGPALPATGGGLAGAAALAALAALALRRRS